MSKQFGLTFVMPSFLAGIGSVLDFTYTSPLINDGPDADFLALQSDWRAMCEDFEGVIERLVPDIPPTHMPNRGAYGEPHD